MQAMHIEVRVGLVSYLPCIQVPAPMSAYNINSRGVFFLRPKFVCLVGHHTPKEKNTVRLLFHFPVHFGTNGNIFEA